jgi:hypothetical protein
MEHANGLIFGGVIGLVVNFTNNKKLPPIRIVSMLP